MIEKEEIVIALILSHIFIFVVGWVISGIIAVQVTVNNMEKLKRNEMEPKKGGNEQ